MRRRRLWVEAGEVECAEIGGDVLKAAASEPFIEGIEVVLIELRPPR